MTPLRLPRAWLARAPARTFFVALAIGGALSVVLLLEGFQSGLYEQLERAVLRRGADLVVVQAGVENFLASRSKLPQKSRGQVEDVPGVAAATPLAMVPIIYESGGRRSPILLVVHQELGGASEIVRGRGLEAPRDIVIDASLASLHDLAPGDPFVVGNFAFRVAGIARYEAAMFTALAFATYDDLLDFYFSSGVSGDPRVEEIADRVLWLEDGALRDRKAEPHQWIRDPVCGMRVDAWTAVWETRHAGTRYVFCSERCRERFERAPDRYLGAQPTLPE